MRRIRTDVILIGSGFLLLVTATWLSWGVPAALTVTGIAVMVFGLGSFIERQP